MRPSNFIRDYIDFLGLELPVEIKIKSKSKRKADAEYWGLYNDGGNLDSHLIHIYNLGGDSRSLNAIIAHELIHAWQEELNYNEIHGKQFQWWAKFFRDEFALEGVYIPELDGKE